MISFHQTLDALSRTTNAECVGDDFTDDDDGQRGPINARKGHHTAAHTPKCLLTLV